MCVIRHWVLMLTAAFLLSGVQAVAETNREFCELAAKYNAATNGFSMLVMVGDDVVFEQYDNGFSAGELYRLASGTKSFWGVAAICAQEDGLLNLDEKVAATISEWKDDSRKSQITIRQLLSFTSGLDTANGELRGFGVENKFTHALSVSVKNKPGAKFSYGASHLFVFGEVLQRKLKAHGKNETPLDYLTRRILDPIGMKVGRWATDESGNPNMPFGAFLTAAEWAKFGRLILNQGSWEGQQIIPADKLRQCFIGSEPNPAYGLNWWLIGKRADRGKRSSKQRMPVDTVAAMGAGKQRLYVIPSMNMVIVRQSESNKFDDNEFLQRLLRGKAELSDEPSAKQPRYGSPIAWFSRLDQDKNGRITKDEMPFRLRDRFADADENGDDELTQAEVEKAMRKPK